MRRHFRAWLLCWEFWVPPLLAIATLAAFIWLTGRNQDLLRQHQIDRSSLHSTERLESKIQSLTKEVRSLQGLHDR